MPAARKPEAKLSIKALVKAHRKVKGEPLHLAMEFRDPKRPKDILLFEVIGGFGGGHVDPDKRFLEVAMANTAVELAPGGELRFLFTSPQELEAANDKNWPAFKRLKANLAKTLVAVHYADPTGEQLKKLLISG
jgi:hypothetical protein